MRFTRDSRLSRKPEFDRVFERAQLRLRQGPLRALAYESGGTRARLGLVIGRRHASRAVDRNRIKRQIRESFRAHAGELPACDVVVQLIDRPAEANLREPLSVLWAAVRNGWCSRRVLDRDAGLQ